MSKNIIDAIYVALGLDNAEYKKGIKEAGDTSHKFAKDEEKRDKARQDSHKKLTEAERSAAKDRSRHEKERDVQARNAITQLNTMKSTVMSMMGLSLGAAGVQKFLSVVITGNAELYRQSRMLKTEMKELDVWMRVADNYRKGSGQSVIGAIQGIQQAKFQASMGTGGQEQMQALGQLGIDPSTVNDTDKLLRAIRNKTKGLDSQAQLYWLSKAGLQDLLPITQQTDQEFEKNLKFAGANSSKNQKLGKDAYDTESEKSNIAHNLEATADELGNNLLPIIKAVTEFLAQHKDAVGYATGAIWALGTAASVVAGAKALGVIGGKAAAGGAAGAGAAAGATRLLGASALALYSSDLNSGEDDAVARSRVKAIQIQNMMNSGMSYDAAMEAVNGQQSGRMSSGKITSSKSPREQALAYFQKQGWSAEQAAGIVANLERESQLNTGAIGDGGKAVGIAQWHPDRQGRFKGLYGEDLKGASLEKQLAFVQWELENTESGAGSMLRGAKTAKEAGAAFSKYYERPGDRNGEAGFRGNSAETILAQSRALIAAGQSSGATISTTNSNNRTTEVRIDNMTIKTAATDGRSIAATAVDGIKERVSSVGVN